MLPETREEAVYRVIDIDSTRLNATEELGAHPRRGFDDDLKFRQTTAALFLQAQAQLGLGNKMKGRALLQTVLKREPGHALTADLATQLQTEAERSISKS